jgi:hypothetical protein
MDPLPSAEVGAGRCGRQDVQRAIDRGELKALRPNAIREAADACECVFRMRPPGADLVRYSKRRIT